MFPPTLRLDEVRKVEHRLPMLEMWELDEVGRLLCHASPPEVRTAWPIDRDYRPTKQELFEVHVFGNLAPHPKDKVEGTYITIRTGDSLEDRYDEESDPQ